MADSSESSTLNAHNEEERRYEEDIYPPEMNQMPQLRQRIHEQSPQTNRKNFHDQHASAHHKTSFGFFTVCSALGIVWFIISVVVMILMVLHIYNDCVCDREAVPCKATSTNLDVCKEQLKICNKRLDNERNYSIKQNENNLDRMDECNVMKNDMVYYQTAFNYITLILVAVLVLVACVIGCFLYCCCRKRHISRHQQVVLYNQHQF